MPSAYLPGQYVCFLIEFYWAWLLFLNFKFFINNCFLKHAINLVKYSLLFSSSIFLHFYMDVHVKVWYYLFYLLPCLPGMPTFLCSRPMNVHCFLLNFSACMTWKSTCLFKATGLFCLLVSLLFIFQLVLARSDVVFTGYDIVPANVEGHSQKFSGKPWKFEVRLHQNKSHFQTKRRDSVTTLSHVSCVMCHHSEPCVTC